MPLDAVKNSLWDLECEQVEPEVAIEMLRLAETRQEAIFRAALGMDQRAAVLSAGFIAAAGALTAGALALGAGHEMVRTTAFSAAVLIGLAAALCGWSCRPQKFQFPGIEPLDWATKPEYLQTPIRDLRLAHAARLQDYMMENEKHQARNGKVLWSGMLLAAATPIMSIIISFAWIYLGI